MSALLDRINRLNFFLMVSLPKNDHEMAVAAENAGAMAIKVHLNVRHPASKTHFGTFSKERASIKKILKSVKIPVGVVPGSDIFALQNELIEMMEMGVDFFDAFARHFPASLLKMPGVGKMVALGEEYTLPMVENMHHIGVGVIEATIFNPKVYGTSLTAKDLVLYRQITTRTPLPVLVPTQKKIQHDELPLLKKAGCRGIVIGAIVTGNSKKGFVQAVNQFSIECSKLNKIDIQNQVVPV